MARVEQAMSSSRFFCTKCGKEGVPIMRKRGQMREAGHLKKLYCIFCQEEVNHAEIRDIGGYSIEDFKQEFEAGRFVDGIRCENSALSICTCDKCPFNVEGKCWNCNKSEKCGHRPE